jgi:membrane protein implicated in regulation of membrane protease activity
MDELGNLGKIFIGVGVCVALVGLLLLIADCIPGIGNLLGWFGKLPGDISIRRDNFSFSFPLATSLLLSIVLSLVFYLISWIFRR